MKQQYPFEGFNIDGEGPTELMSFFSQWINEGLYKHHAKKRDNDDHNLANCSNLEFKQLDFVFAFPKKKDCVVPEYENKIVGTIKGFGIPTGLHWHLTNEVYVNGEFHWVLEVVVLKERRIKQYDSIFLSRTNRKLCAEIQTLSTMLPKYLESSKFYEQKDPTNCDYGVFIAAYAEFLSDGIQTPSDGIISQSFRFRYASFLWNYGILKDRSGYVSNNEDPQRPRPKKAKFDENVVVTTID
ncbi:hypothetical protein KY285_027592 [Solanum tuberosum]|nr:hypothetical protein KY289_027789 [Solanum tuberosum]KAH0666386.1 hypothetical protein KY285_027592 [Solanum tuberosum]